MLSKLCLGSFTDLKRNQTCLKEFSNIKALVFSHTTVCKNFCLFLSRKGLVCHKRKPGALFPNIYFLLSLGENTFIS